MIISFILHRFWDLTPQKCLKPLMLVWAAKRGNSLWLPSSNLPHKCWYISLLFSEKLRDPSFSGFVAIYWRYIDNSRTFQYNCNVRLKKLELDFITLTWRLIVQAAESVQWKGDRAFSIMSVVHCTVWQIESFTDTGTGVVIWLWAWSDSSIYVLDPGHCHIEDRICPM